MNIQHNLEIGIEGEQMTSEALDGLEISHIHNDFSSLEAYSKTMGKGVDIKSDGWKFWMEVKNFPNSWLNSLDDYQRLIKPRFKDTPIEFIKFTVVIGGRVKRSWLVIPNRDGIIVIHAEPKYLQSKLEYYFKKEGIIKEDKEHGGYTYQLEYYLDNGSIRPNDNEIPNSKPIEDKGPPLKVQDSANSGSSVNLG